MPRSELTDEDKNRLSNLKRNVRGILKDRAMSERTASKLCGYSDRWLSSWLDDTKAIDPGSIRISTLADVLDVPVSRLYAKADPLPISDGSITPAANLLEASQRLSGATESDTVTMADLLNRERALDVLKLWLETSGVIDGRFEQLLPHFDLIVPGRGKKPLEALHLGRNSLAATAMESTDPAALEYFASEYLDPEESRELRESMATVLATNRGTITAPDRFIPAENGRPAKQLRFARAHLPAVLLQRGMRRPVILNVAHLVKRLYGDANIPDLVIPDGTKFELTR